MQGPGKRDEKIDFPCAEGERDSHSEAVRGMYQANIIIIGAANSAVPKKYLDFLKKNPDLHTVFKILIKTGIFSAYIDDLESSIYQIRAIQQ